MPRADGTGSAQSKITRSAIGLAGCAAKAGVSRYGSETIPHLRTAADDDDGGRGLRLVKELSNRWGTRRTTTGKTVWFELRLDPLPDF